MATFMQTINSDDEIDLEADSSEEEQTEKSTKKQSKAKGGKKKEKLVFSFDFDDGQFRDQTTDASSDSEVEEDSESDEEKVADNVRIMPRAEERIARAATKSVLKKQLKEQQGQTGDSAVDGTSAKDSKRKKKGAAVAAEEEEEGEEQGGLDGDGSAEYFERVIEARARGAEDSSSAGGAGSGGAGQILFSQLSLSRPLLRAVERTGYVSATPIQAQTIPYALAGKDICASAETGSGKTAAFVLPFLERLLYRPRDVASIRVLVITPTRELAQQIHAVLEKLAQYTDVTSVLICGGKKDVRSQETTLRQRPDVVICTPGRMLDHLRNSQSVSLDDLDVLVLDEADRLLDLGFQEEVEQLVKYCPISRQTLLFSATMTSRVEDLVKLSLKRPVRVRITGGNNGDGEGGGSISFAPRLVQEFIKVRSSTGATVAGSADIPGSSGVDQEVVEAMLLALVCRSFGKQCIVFFEMKRNAHRFCALLALMKVKAAELHGDVTQAQRYLALERFRTQQVDVLVATDVAARGLDIPGVQTVINAEMPRNLSIYVHRVGRTARAGCGGRSITLVSDARRKMMKEVLRMKGEGAAANSSSGNNAADADASAVSGGQVLSRTIPGAVLAQYTERIRALEPELRDYFREERLKANLDSLQMEAEKAENMLLHEQEINARPARTWYQTETQKGERRETSREQVKDEQAAAQLGKSEALVQKSATERARALALTDDYPLEKGKDKAHKLSRKKRRRLEALAASNEGGDSGEEEGERRAAAAIQAAPKRAKVSLRDKEEAKRDRILSDIGMKRVPVQRHAPASASAGADGEEGGDAESIAREAAIANKHGKGKGQGQGKGTEMRVVRQSFAVGGLDQDYVDWGMGAEGGSKGGMTKTQIRQAARERPFTDFDASKKLKKGGKAGNKAFKSKSKFKRR